MAKKFKQGDIVKVTKKVLKEEGWRNSWVEPMDDFIHCSMDEYIGNEYVVDFVDASGVYFDAQIKWGFPPSSLKLIKR